MKMPRIYTFDVPDFDNCGGRTMRRVEVPKRTFREIETDVAAPLEADNAALRAADRSATRLIEEKAAEIEALRAEVERLCKALEQIAQRDGDGFHMHTPQAMEFIARAALTERKP